MTKEVGVANVGEIAEATEGDEKLEEALGVGEEGGAGELFLKNSKVVS
jgi:hypothetical protein